jgi:hypothetical protein
MRYFWNIELKQEIQTRLIRTRMRSRSKCGVGRWPVIQDEVCDWEALGREIEKGWIMKQMAMRSRGGGLRVRDPRTVPVKHFVNPSSQRRDPCGASQHCAMLRKI